MLTFFCSKTKGEMNDFCEWWRIFAWFWRHVLKLNCRFPFNFKRGKHLAVERTTAALGALGRHALRNAFLGKTRPEQKSKKRWGQKFPELFSAVWELQDLQSFAPLQFQNLSNISWKIFGFLPKILQKIAIFQRFSSNFAPILIKISRNFVEYSSEW